VLVYNVPGFTAVNMDSAAVARAAQNPQHVGIKTRPATSRTGRHGAAWRDRETFQVWLAGFGGLFFRRLGAGAVGGILALANIAPQLLLDIYRLFHAGRWTRRPSFSAAHAAGQCGGDARLASPASSRPWNAGLLRGPCALPLLDLGSRARHCFPSGEGWVV